MAGSFSYVGNSATGIVHRKATRNDACAVAEIKPENRENFHSLVQALALKRGNRKKYRACKICIPES